jgi:hypothetical protein
MYYGSKCSPSGQRALMAFFPLRYDLLLPLGLIPLRHEICDRVASVQLNITLCKLSAFGSRHTARGGCLWREPLA